MVMEDVQWYGKKFFVVWAGEYTVILGENGFIFHNSFLKVSRGNKRCMVWYFSDIHTSAC